MCLESIGYTSALKDADGAQTHQKKTNDGRNKSNVYLENQSFHLL